MQGAEEEERAPGLRLYTWVLMRDGRFQHTTGVAAGPHWTPKGHYGGAACGAGNGWSPVDLTAG